MAQETYPELDDIDESIDEGALNIAVALEFYLRLRRSSLIGCLGVLVMSMAEFGHASVQKIMGWTAAMIGVMLYRVVRSHTSVKALLRGQSINTIPDEGLSVLTGALWASTMFLFDTGQVDTFYYYRLIILFAAVSFTQASLSVYPRTYIAFLSVIWFVLAIFSFSDSVASMDLKIIIGMLIYFVMLVSNAYHLSRLVRRACTDHLRLKGLSARIGRQLEGEKRTLEHERKLKHELEDANQRLDHLARHDGLTELLNRSASLTLLSVECDRASRGGGPLTVALIDIDHFKNVNDQFGHLAGDEVLRQVAGQLRIGTRSGDCAGRYGGEEFLLTLPQTDIDQARVIMERIRSQVAATPMPTEAGDVKVTISIGLAEWEKGETIEALLGRSDRALYQAKALGRNQCVLATS